MILFPRIYLSVKKTIGKQKKSHDGNKTPFTVSIMIHQNRKQNNQKTYFITFMN